MKTPSHFLNSPESPNIQLWKSSAESSMYRAQKQHKYRSFNEEKHRELQCEQSCTGNKGRESRVCHPHRQSAEDCCKMNGLDAEAFNQLHG